MSLYHHSKTLVTAVDGTYSGGRCCPPPGQKALSRLLRHPRTDGGGPYILKPGTTRRCKIIIINV